MATHHTTFLTTPQCMFQLFESAKILLSPLSMGLPTSPLILFWDASVLFIYKILCIPHLGFSTWVH